MRGGRKGGSTDESTHSSTPPGLAAYTTVNTRAFPRHTGNNENKHVVTPPLSAPSVTRALSGMRRESERGAGWQQLVARHCTECTSLTQCCTVGFPSRTWQAGGGWGGGVAVYDTSCLLLYLYTMAFYTLGEGGEGGAIITFYPKKTTVPIMIIWTVRSVLSAGAV